MLLADKSTENSANFSKFAENKRMRYFISAGEASGDLHAAELIKALRELDPEAQFAILGGDLMAAASGVSPTIHYRDMAFMASVRCFVICVRYSAISVWRARLSTAMRPM